MNAGVALNRSKHHCETTRHWGSHLVVDLKEATLHQETAGCFAAARLCLGAFLSTCNVGLKLELPVSKGWIMMDHSLNWVRNCQKHPQTSKILWIFCGDSVVHGLSMAFWSVFHRSSIRHRNFWGHGQLFEQSFADARNQTYILQLQRTFHAEETLRWPANVIFWTVNIPKLTIVL